MSTSDRPWIREDPSGIVIKLFVQPRSSKNMVVGIHGDALKIKLTAPPVDDAANKMCIRFLAKTLNVPKSRLEILSGHTGRTKQVMLKFDSTQDTTAHHQACLRLIEKKLG